MDVFAPREIFRPSGVARCPRGAAVHPGATDVRSDVPTPQLVPPGPMLVSNGSEFYDSMLIDPSKKTHVFPLRRISQHIWIR
eukprot:4304025-Pyramimonas_sp.AAC.1